MFPRVIDLIELFSSKCSLCENYLLTTGQSDWLFPNFYLSRRIFTCHIIEYQAKFDKSYLSLWQVNSTIRRQVLPGIDLRQTRFHMDCKCFDIGMMSDLCVGF